MAKDQIDVEALYSALDAQRTARGLSWRQLAKELQVSPSLLSRMANGLRPDADAFITLVQWLGVPAEQFAVGVTRPRSERSRNWSRKSDHCSGPVRTSNPRTSRIWRPSSTPRCAV